MGEDRIKDWTTWKSDKTMLVSNRTIETMESEMLGCENRDSFFIEKSIEGLFFIYRCEL